MKLRKKVNLPVPTKNFKERCQAECTGNVIFLLQSRFLNLVDIPYGWEFDDDCHSLLMTEDDADYSTDEQEKQFLKWKSGEYTELQPEISIEQLYELNDEHFCEVWNTECVFLSREEGEEFAERTKYRYPQGYRVYGVCAAGQLVDLIKET